MTPKYILLVEDSESDATLVKHVLSKLEFTLHIDVIKTLKELSLHLDKHKPDLVISDYNLSMFNGLDVFKIVKEKYPFISFMLVSGSLGEERAVDCIQMGMNSYVLKDNLIRLPNEVKRLLRENEMRNNLRESLRNQSVLYQIAYRASNNEPDLQTLLDGIKQELNIALPLDDMLIVLLDPSDGQLQVPFFSQHNHKIRNGLKELALIMANYCYFKQSSFILNSKKEFEDLFGKDVIKKAGLITHSMLITPLSNESEIVGFLSIINTNQENAYTDNDQNLLEFVSGLIGSVVLRLTHHQNLENSKAQYKSLVHKSKEGIWRLELDPPLSIKLAPNTLVKKIILNGKIQEANNNTASFFGMESAEQIRGCSLSDLYLGRHTELTKAFKDFVINKFNLDNFITIEHPSTDERLFVSNNIIGIVENDQLVRLWGQQMDITETVQAQRMGNKFQLMLLSSQLNPHFIFNSLSSIQYFIIDNNSEEAITFLNGFSTLMRKVLDNSRHLFINLKSEISFLEEYLKLEQVRFKNRFSFKISAVAQIDTNEMYIPPMLLQPLIENAIIHGIGNIKHRGLIKISFKLKKQSIIVEIEDNGVGRQQAAKFKHLRGTEHTSRALNITDIRLNLLNNIANDSFETTTIDLTKKGAPSGTLVRIRIPNNLSPY